MKARVMLRYNVKAKYLNSISYQSFLINKKIVQINKYDVKKYLIVVQFCQFYNRQKSQIEIKQ